MTEKSDTKKSAEASASVEMITVSFAGAEYSIPKHIEDRPLLFNELLAQNRITDALVELLGRKQADAFLMKHRTWRSFNEFFEAIAKTSGGNS